MQRNERAPKRRHLVAKAMTLAAGVIAAAGAVRADPSNDAVMVPPAALPALARQGGEAMFLHETVDGKTRLYVEQNRGAQLALFDVTDPAHIKGEGSVQLNASGPFDFVSPLGSQAELVRFRDGSAEAVLELPRVKAPNLRATRGLDSAALGGGADPRLVRAQVTKADTGTTFLLTESGLSVIRRPALESLHQLMMIAPN